MQSQFDQVINRQNTASLKWDGTESKFGVKDILPMWVADMDFMAPKPVLDAIKQRVEHGVLGYSIQPESYYTAICDWMNDRFNWTVRKEWIYFSPGVVPALNFIIQAFSAPDDKIIVQPPVYYPFSNAVINNGRQLVYNPLKFQNGRYTMDFADLKSKLDSKVKLLILSNPHNPVGRVWTKSELAELGQICLEHKVLVVSDEIHADLMFSGYKHTPFAAISNEFAQNSITCTAPSKTFNLAGLQTSSIIIPNQKFGDIYADQLKKCHLLRPNVLGLVATESAYRYGKDWLNQLLIYLQANLDFLLEYFESKIKPIRVIKPEGTYLIWLDCRGLGMTGEDLDHFMLHQARVALDGGSWFGPGGEGFARINIACPRETLADGLRRIEKAVNSYRGKV